MRMGVLLLVGIVMGLTGCFMGDGDEGKWYDGKYVGPSAPEFYNRLVLSGSSWERRAVLVHRGPELRLIGGVTSNGDTLVFSFKNGWSDTTLIVCPECPIANWKRFHSRGDTLFEISQDSNNGKAAYWRE